MYYPPEKMNYQENNLICKKKSDMWSFGMVLYIMSEGCLPKRDENGIIIKKCECNNLNFIINKLLDENPENRLSANEILNII